MTILNLIRPELLNGKNYTPGGEDTLHRLHTNELPWSPIPTNSLHLNQYPDQHIISELHKKLAQHYQIKVNEMTVTRGNDDGIDLVTRLFLSARQDAFLQFPPTFPLYEFYVRLQQAELLQCPLDLDNHFKLTLNDIQKAWKPNCKIIMFCNPNNPTASCIDLELIAATCKHYTNKSAIIVDEAYIDFSSQKSATTLIQQFENLIVLRTLSKGCGLASLRLGALIAQPHIVEAVNKTIAPYTLSSAPAYLANQALDNKDWFPTIINLVKKERERLIKELGLLAIIEKVYPSETNFVLIKTPYAKELKLWFEKEKIAIRDFPFNSPLHDHLRITVGTEAQNELVCATIISFTNHQQCK